MYSEKIPHTDERIYIERTGHFQYKTIVSNLLKDVISDSILYAKDYIEKIKDTTFCWGELQMHSILHPSLFKNTDYCILEYPITRKVGRQNRPGNVDYYCRCNLKKSNEYHLFLELKSSRTGLPLKKYRNECVSLWHEAYKQIRGIEKEIKMCRKFGLYKEPVLRVCMETIVLYAHENRSFTESSIDDAIKIAIEQLGGHQDTNGFPKPNFVVLWKFSDALIKDAKDEFNDSRKIYGIIFVCHIMEPLYLA